MIICQIKKKREIIPFATDVRIHIFREKLSQISAMSETLKKRFFLFVFITSCSRKIGHLRGQQTKDETEDSYELINHISNEPSFRFLSFPELLFTCERCPS